MELGASFSKGSFSGKVQRKVTGTDFGETGWNMARSCSVTLGG